MVPEPPTSLWGLAPAVVFGHRSEVTGILSAIEQSDPEAAEELVPLVYAEPRQLAARRARGARLAVRHALGARRKSQGLVSSEFVSRLPPQSGTILWGTA
jgi:hypothetical protein